VWLSLQRQPMEYKKRDVSAWTSAPWCFVLVKPCLFPYRYLSNMSCVVRSLMRGKTRRVQTRQPENKVAFQRLHQRGRIAAERGECWRTLPMQSPALYKRKEGVCQHSLVAATVASGCQPGWCGGGGGEWLCTAASPPARLPPARPSASGSMSSQTAGRWRSTVEGMRRCRASEYGGGAALCQPGSEFSHCGSRPAR